MRNVNQWDIQVAFDKECYNECHRGEGVKLHSHRNSGDAFVIAPVELGTHITRADAASVGVIVDRHITTRASEAMPDYAPCVSCHDPHGSGVDPVVDRSNPPRPSNRMLRGASNNTSSALCVPCHSLPQ